MAISYMDCSQCHFDIFSLTWHIHEKRGRGSIVIHSVFKVSMDNFFFRLIKKTNVIFVLQISVFCCNQNSVSLCVYRSSKTSSFESLLGFFFLVFLVCRFVYHLLKFNNNDTWAMVTCTDYTNNYNNLCGFWCFILFFIRKV